LIFSRERSDLITLQKKGCVPKESISVRDILPNLNAKTEQKEPEKTGSESSMEEEKVIALARERGFVTRKEVEILLGIGQTTCGRLLKQMIGNGLIVQEGKGKNTHYCLPK